ncbi:methionyl-tRNA formyltransferase [Streptomyces tendae]|uniref:methionyl-tRNA formyltransferase n=1 Tax=Streptomyces tendae TaxID=1932 RepID=UPI003D7417D1
MSKANARVVVLTSFLPNFQLLASWAERHGHQIPLVVTPPGGSGHYGGGELSAGLGKGVSLLVTGKLRTVAAPLIAALAPDLVISAAFPRLIPSEILTIPTYGAVNLHPSVLPAGRGPNPLRLLYEGAETIGATLHRTEAEFDTGAVLSQRERPLPERLSGPSVLNSWSDMFAEVIEEGTARALAGEPGLVQDSTRASYMPPFSDEERVLDFTEPAATISRKVAALNVLVPRALTRLPGCEGTVLHVEVLPSTGRSAGTVVAAHPDGCTVQTADLAVRVTVERGSSRG